MARRFTSTGDELVSTEWEQEPHAEDISDARLTRQVVRAIGGATLLIMLAGNISSIKHGDLSATVLFLDTLIGGVDGAAVIATEIQASRILRTVEPEQSLDNRGKY